MFLLSKKGSLLSFLGIGLVLNLVGHSVALQCYSNICGPDDPEPCKSPKGKTLVECKGADNCIITKALPQDESSAEYVAYLCGEDNGKDGCFTTEDKLVQSNEIRKTDVCYCKGDGCNTASCCSCSGKCSGGGSGSASILGFSSVLMVVSTFLTGTHHLVTSSSSL